MISPDEKFPSPDRAVRPVPGAVEYDPDGVAIQTVFSHAGGKMGMMVLHPDQRDSGVFSKSG